MRLVILLYEQAIEDLRRAVQAQSRGEIEQRTREINHALLVIGHLQATLDMERGGKVAKNLEQFYQQLQAALAQAQREQSISLLERQISCLSEVRQAWCEVERATTPTAHEDRPLSSDHPLGDWSA